MIIFYNPHVDDFLAEPVQFRFIGRKALKKYGFIFEEALKTKKVINILVDATESGLVPNYIFCRIPKFLRVLITNLELKLWKKINKFGDDLIKINPKNSPSLDTLFTFSYKSATYNFFLRENLFRSYNCVVFHLSHYFIETKLKSDNIKLLNNAYLAGDSDISENQYFLNFFNWYKKPFLVLPFAVDDRFICKKVWNTRLNMVIATGTFHYLDKEKPSSKYENFIETTRITTYHPVRRQIFELSSMKWHFIHSLISPYRNYCKNKLTNFINKFNISQSKYFSVNIVDEYNKYKYAVIGEEVTGFPALGSLEAIACGCILFAVSEFYVSMGLIPHVHYIPYSGNIDEMFNLIKTNNGYEDISNNGVLFIKEYYSKSSVFKNWEKTLIQL